MSTTINMVEGGAASLTLDGWFAAVEWEVDGRLGVVGVDVHVDVDDVARVGVVGVVARVDREPSGRIPCMFKMW